MAQRWEVELPIHPSAAGLARRTVMDRFSAEMAPLQLEDAALVVSELVGQAFIAGPPRDELRITGEIWDGGVRVTVQDDRAAEGPDVPVSLVPDSVAYRIVASLTEAFGERRVNDVTIVWCELPRGEPDDRLLFSDERDGAGSRVP